MPTVSLTDSNQAKRWIWDLWSQMNHSPPEAAVELARGSMHPNVRWRGPAPINDLSGAENVVDGFWTPLYEAVPELKRQCSVFMSGVFKNRVWVSATGYLSGTMVNSWLGIPATGNPIHIRFGEFCAVADGQIEEVIIGLDVIDVMRQAGFPIIDGYGGKAGLVPAPVRGDGIMLADQNPEESNQSLRLLDLLTALLNQYDGKDLGSVRSTEYKPSNYQWYGPGGIGSTSSLAEFERCHQKPFLTAFADRRFGAYDAAIGEGGYASCAAWPSMYATHVADYLGATASDKPITLRFMDWFTRDGDKFIENRVWFDLIDLLQQCGVDLMAKLQQKLER